MKQVFILLVLSLSQWVLAQSGQQNLSYGRGLENLTSGRETGDGTSTCVMAKQSRSTAEMTYQALRLETVMDTLKGQENEMLRQKVLEILNDEE